MIDKYTGQEMVSPADVGSNEAESGSTLGSAKITESIDWKRRYYVLGMGAVGLVAVFFIGFGGVHCELL